MQPPEDLLQKGKVLYGLDDEPEELEQEDILSKGKSVFVPSEDDSQTESWGKYGARVAKQLGLRVGETALGAGTDFARAAALPGQMMESALDSITPDTLKEKGLGLGKLAKSPHQYFIEHLAETGKGTKEVREIFKELTGGEYEPRGSLESIAGGMAQDLPLAFLTRGASIPRTVATSLIGNTSKELLKDFGFGETGQEVGKFAAQTLTSLINPTLVTDYFRNNYNAARNAIPPNQTVDANPILRSLANVRARAQARIGTGVQQAENRATVARIDEIANRANQNGGRLPVRDIWDFKRAINGEMNTYGTLFHPLQTPLRNSLNQYGRTNPTFLTHFKNGDQSFMTYQNSRRLARSIRDITRMTPHSIVGTALLDGMQGKWATIGTLGTSMAGVKAYEIVSRALTRDPTVRNLYFRTLAEASARNAPAFLKNFHKLEKKVQEVGKEKPKKNKLTHENESIKASMNRPSYSRSE